MIDPTPGFEFPPDKRDQIGDSLKAVISNGERQPLQSVRPNRRVGPNPVVTPVAEDTDRLAPAPSVPVSQFVQPKPIAKMAPKPELMVKVTAVPTTPVSEPEGTSIDLPSRFHYYDFKDLYVKPFRLFHLAKIASAHSASSMQGLAEVVSSVLSTPQGHTNIAFQLHMEDFNAVLYWLRLSSFSKKQMRVRYQCSNPAHHKAVEMGQKTPESLNVAALYTESDLKFVYLNEVPDPSVFQFELEGYGTVTMRPETVTDVIDFMDHPSWEDPEFQYKARIAAVLELLHPDGSNYRLSEKVDVLDALSPDIAALALQFADIVDGFGVSEIVQSNCIGCGASSAVKIAVDAPCFLSPEF